jgi:hypothetical protein
VTLNAFRVYDEDRPPDPSNNFDGEGRFLMSLLKFDLDCRSRTEADTTTLSGGVLTATNDLWRFIFPTGLGALELQDARVETTFSPDLVTGMGRLGARTTLCSLSELTFPGETPGSVLDVFVNDPAIRAAVSVDVDRDGDGFEQVEGDGVTVLHCVDGDGTIIPGSSCPCHPAIADGYTVAIGIEIVHGQVVGVL